MSLPKHTFWAAGDPDCPPELKAPNGELHTARCKLCGSGWRKSGNVCMEALIDAVRELPFVNAPEIDGEESDGTPRYYRSRRYVSLTKLERLLRGNAAAASSPAPEQQAGRTAEPAAWLDKWGEAHRRQEDAYEPGDEFRGEPLYRAADVAAPEQQGSGIDGVPACLCGQPISDECKTNGCRWEKEKKNG